MHDLQTYFDECCQTLDLLRIPYAKNCRLLTDARLKRSWGNCRMHPDGTFTIKISPVLLEDSVPPDSLKDTLYHELLHTVPGAMSHGSTWLSLAQRVNQATGLRIKRSTPASEKGVNQDYVHDLSVKFLCVCENCGAQIVRYRQCDLMRRTNRYRCAACGGKFKVIIKR